MRKNKWALAEGGSARAQKKNSVESPSYTPSRRHRASDQARTGVEQPVSLISRYKLAHEVKTLQVMERVLGPELRPLVASIYVDSKTTGSYLVTMKQWDKEAAAKIAARIEGVAAGMHSGHNGIGVQCADQLYYIEACWDEEV
jgi:hypothetical protein